MTFREFLPQQARRFWLRAYVVRASLTALGFWALFLTAGQWMSTQGKLPMALWITLLAVWLFALVPVLLLQLRWIIDVLLYAGTGRTSYYRQGQEEVERTGEWLAQLSDGQQRKIRRIANIVLLVAHSSPLSGLGVWALVVLSRMPDAAHEPAPQSRRQLNEVLSRGRAEEERLVREFAGRAMLWSH